VFNEPINDGASVITTSPSFTRDFVAKSIICCAPEVVSLSAGNPSPEAFPIEEIKEISSRLLEENPIGVLQYSVTEGYPQLRETLKKYMKSHHNVGRDFDDILIKLGIV